MDKELALINQKLDLLTERLESETVFSGRARTSQNGTDLASLHQKVDQLTAGLERIQQRQEEMDELKRDLLPIANHMIKLSIDELAEIGTEFQLEDLFFLIKRLLRDTHLLIALLDRLESTMELIGETETLGKQAFHQAVIHLDRMEREGYFTFAREGWRIVERIVHEFSPEDIQALGDNIVTIMTTVRNLTQPEIMAMTNNALFAMRDQTDSSSTPSAWTLARELSDPKVRKGMARLLNIVKTLADQPTIQKN